MAPLLMANLAQGPQHTRQKVSGLRCSAHGDGLFESRRGIGILSQIAVQQSQVDGHNHRATNRPRPAVNAVGAFVVARREIHVAAVRFENAEIVGRVRLADGVVELFCLHERLLPAHARGVRLPEILVRAAEPDQRFDRELRGSGPAKEGRGLRKRVARACVLPRIERNVGDGRECPRLARFRSRKSRKPQAFFVTAPGRLRLTPVVVDESLQRQRRHPRRRIRRSLCEGKGAIDSRAGRGGPAQLELGPCAGGEEAPDPGGVGGSLGRCHGAVDHGKRRIVAGGVDEGIGERNRVCPGETAGRCRGGRGTAARGDRRLLGQGDGQRHSGRFRGSGEVSERPCHTS